MTRKDKANMRKQILDGTIYTKKRYKNWRKRVFRRDRYTCQFPGCGKVGGSLQAHHIKKKFRFPELTYILSNGITLCYNCHQKLHRDKLERKYFSSFRKKTKENKSKTKKRSIRRKNGK